MISEAMVKFVKYSPEKIPDAQFVLVPALAEAAPPVLDLKRIQPFIVTLSDIQLVANAAVILRARYDGVRVEESTAAMLSGLVGAWGLPGLEFIYLNFIGTAAGPVANFRTHYGLWVVKPTVAHKLFHRLTLTNEEKDIAEHLGIFNTVEKGMLPIPISQQIEREYHVVGEETHARSINIAVANTVYTVENIYSRPDEFVVLTRVAAAPGLAAQIVNITIDRDQDISYGNLRTFPLSLLAGGEVSCFIPAMDEIKISTTASVAPGPHLFRYTYQRVKRTNLLRVRFGLVSKDEVPGDLWSKVKGGIL